MKEYLDSDRLNFLVWRYLLESNYREAATKLQKEWGIKEPHRHFDFAQHVRSHSLVYVVNKGLSYASLERESHRNVVCNHLTTQTTRNLHAHHASLPSLLHTPQLCKTAIETTKPSAVNNSASSDSPASVLLTCSPQSDAVPDPQTEFGFFGPVTLPPPKTYARLSSRIQHQKDNQEEDGEADADGEADDEVVTKQEDPEDVSMEDSTVIITEDATARKRPLSTHLPNGTAKKPKLAENGDDTTIPMSMDIDSGEAPGSNHAYPSPLEGDETSATRPHTDGPEQGTQEKTKDLTTDTIYLDLAIEKPRVGPALPVERSPTTPSPVLLLCEWSPTNPNILAAAGTDSMSRLYTINHTTDRDDNQPFCKLLEEDAPRDTQVTALSWSRAEGNILAIATEQGGKARINIWAGDGTHIHLIDVAEGPVIKLAWNRTGTALLAISPSTDNGTLLSIYKVPTLASSTHTISNHDFTSVALDVTWTNESTFLVCGGQLLQTFSCSGPLIEPVRTFETDSTDALVHVAYDDRALIAAASSDTGTITLIDGNGSKRKISAHTHPITALKWQPEALAGAENRLLASAGEDGAVLVWDPKCLETKPKKFLTMSGGPIVALAFSPDGEYLAGATALHVYIWKVGDTASIPYAKWKRTPHPGWNGPTPSGENEDTFEHCLAWDSTGQKVAYGVNSRLAVISFR
ncbi:hypothetical protein Cpir12675_005032 [Ceratocystis pirilliformis]|uniref:LisH domain-containing protein n=1 Tax=Ceratocystis pirilliformis TaxID=259994 RepID=A0ABR3YT22_9PEZI